MSEENATSVICKYCGNSNFYAREKRTLSDGRIVKRFQCKHCWKFGSIPLSEATKIKKVPPCPNCRSSDKVHRKKLDKSEKDRYYCYECKIIYAYPYHWSNKFPICPYCATNTSIFRIKPINGIQCFRCQTCDTKFREDKQANSPIIREPCTKCSSRNTIKHGFTEEGKQEYFCYDCKSCFYLNRNPCWKCGSTKFEILIAKKELRLVRCKSCKALNPNLTESELLKFKDLVIKDIPAHKKKIMYLENEIKKLESTLSLYQRYLTETGLIKNLEQWNKSTKDHISKDKYHLRIDLVLSKLQVPYGRIIAIIVSTSYDGFRIFEGKQELAVLRDFFKYLKSLPYYTFFVYDLHLCEIITARAAQYVNIKVPNLLTNSGKFKGIYDLKTEIDNPSSSFNSMLQEMIDSLDLMPLPLTESMSVDKKMGEEIATLWKHVNKKKSYQLGKNQIKNLFDGSKESERNKILTARIKVIDAIYYNMRWVKDG